MACGDGGDQVRGVLEAASEHDPEDRPIAQFRQRLDLIEALLAAEPPGAEPPLRRSVLGCEREGVGIAEQVEDEGNEPGAPGRLRQGAARLRRDEDGAVIVAQPATSTARV